LLSRSALLLVFVQIALGVGILMSFRNEVVTTLHVMFGAALLVVNTLLMYRAAYSASASKHVVANNMRTVEAGR